MKKNIQKKQKRLGYFFLCMLGSWGVTTIPALAQNVGLQDQINYYLVRNKLTNEFPYAYVPGGSIRPGGMLDYAMLDYSEPVLKLDDPTFKKRINRFFIQAFANPSVNQIRLEVTQIAVDLKRERVVKPFVINGIRQPATKSFKISSNVIEATKARSSYPYGTPGYALEVDRIRVNNLLSSTFPDFEVRNTGGGNEPEGAVIDYSVIILPDQNMAVQNKKTQGQFLDFFKKAFDNSYAAVIRIQVFKRSLENFNAAYPPRLLTLRMTRFEVDSAKRTGKAPSINIIDGRFGIPIRQINGESGRDAASDVWKVLNQLKVEFYACNQLLCGKVNTSNNGFWEAWSGASAQRFAGFQVKTTLKDAQGTLRREYCGPKGANFQIQTYRNANGDKSVTELTVLPAFYCPMPR